MKNGKNKGRGHSRVNSRVKKKKLSQFAHFGYGDKKYIEENFSAEEANFGKVFFDGIESVEKVSEKSDLYRDEYKERNSGSKKRSSSRFGGNGRAKSRRYEEVTGVVEGTKNGYAFLIRDDGKEDCFIAPENLCGALNGDKVVASVVERASGRSAAKVEEIVERGVKRVVGTYYSNRFGGYVVSDDQKYNTEVNIDKNSTADAATGDKVVCEITAFYDRGCPEGIITSVLGKRFSRKAEVASIAAAYNFESEFSEDTLKEAERVSKDVKITVRGRKNFKDDLTVTIDGETAKDYDDAICVKKLQNGYELGVHIADVSEYVRENSELDRSALSRGTSVYFPESVIPMLPETLCNDKCSLLPNEDRLTLSCVMKFDLNGDMTEYNIYKSVIRSKARLTYNDVFAYLSGEITADLNKISSETGEMLKNAYELYSLIKKKRSDRGSVDLDVGDSEIYVKNGKVVVERAKTDFAHGMIENFMISANEAVARYAQKNKLPFVYRIHEKPSEEKVAAISTFLQGLSVRCDFDEDVSPKAYREILQSVEGEPIRDLVNKMMLRSMQKAKYSPENLGHFGLASTCYCHFTSPIRRYPDLFVHRVLKKYIDNKEEKEVFSTKQVGLADAVSEKSSKTERNAELAERAADDYYKTVYMSGFIGESFKGVISGVTARGFFVELDNTCEGMVKIDSLKGRYNFDEANLTLFSGTKRFRIGDEVEIIVADADLLTKKTEFILKEENIRCKNKKRIVK